MTPEQFKAWRTGLGLSQTAAASALGISRSSVVNYESGERREDGRPVEIPSTIQAACDAVSIASAASREAPWLLPERLYKQVMDIAFRACQPSSYMENGNQIFTSTTHEAMQKAGQLSQNVPSLVDRLNWSVKIQSLP